MLPIVLSLAGRTVVVVGGGPVGRRKARAASAAGAAVRIVDPDPRVERLAAPGTESVLAPYWPDHLAGAALVFAAGPPGVNARVVADARALGIWVCDATDPDRGDFTLPAVGRRGGLTVAVSTGGAAPALARRVRDEWLAGLDDAYAAWVEILHGLRSLVQMAIPDQTARARLLAEFTEPAWLERIRTDGAAATRAAMTARVAAAAGSASPPPADDIIGNGPPPQG